MAYVKAPIPSEVYHLTQMEKLDDILDDGKIRRFGDTECWFCESLAKLKAYMEQTVLCEGKPYYGAGGQLCHYAFLSIHLDGLSVLDFLSFVVSFYITEQQIFEWEDPT